MLNRSVEFVELPSAERERYLDKQLETVQGWQLESILVAENGGAGLGGQAQMLKLMGNLAVWADRAPEPHREAYKLLIGQLQQYAVKKVLNLQ